MYDETVRRAVASDGRHALQEPRVKLLLGLLLTVGDRRSLRDAFAPFCRPIDPAIEIVSGVRQLAARGVIPFEIDDLSAQMLLETLYKPAVISGGGAPAHIEGPDAEAIRSRQRRLEESIILKSLFTEA